ncbi:MAG: formylglycine-generating enzyme family protein [Candidatus Competibacteraceae bacterium]|nr:formylglycine-generating enzyme family protein [Candidatus Competibacteraceae bacterium]
MPKARFYRVVANRRLEPEEVVRNEPVWFQRAEPFQEDELRAPVNISPPPQPPLLPWSRLWPFLKTALGARQTTQALDIPRILARLARAQTLRYLPRRQRHGWAAESQLIVDYAEPLLPFWTDFNQLYQRLRRLRGARGLRLIAFPDGDPSGRCWRHDGREWRESGDGPMLGAGARVLVLSDLGCNDPGDVRRRQWRYLGARLRRAGCRPVALMPCPPRWWDSELTRLFEPVGWDRGARLPKRLGERQRAPASSAPRESDSGAERLLALLAPAIRIEPALLRAVRYLLPAREADVGSEAAAWNHPKVHATPLAFYYDQEAVAGYRRAFQGQDADLRREVADLIVAHHLPLSPAIGHEERGVLANLQDVCDLEAQRFMARIVRMLRDRNDAMAESVQAWVGRLTPRQHEAMWQDAALAAAWALVNRTALREGQVTPPPGLDLGRVSWVFGPDRALKHYTLRQRGPALYLEAAAPAAPASDLDAPGSPVADLGAAADYVQVQRLETSDQSIQPLDQAILLPASGRLWIKTDYQELILDSIERPEWAEAMGRDEYGLYVDFCIGGVDHKLLAVCDRIGDVVQRLRWIMPGEFLMGSPASEAERLDRETQHRVILTQGYWLADTTCTQALWQAVLGDNPSHFKGEDRPVENVNWDDAQRFIARLNELILGDGFRLPTEAEWEYACRAGTTTAFWFGDQITPEQVNYNGNIPYAGGPKGQYREQTVAVKALPCNGWGLYQMHGNVWEWCQDWFGDYPTETVVDPTGPAGGEGRVLRGGSWIDHGGFARSAARYHYDPGLRFDFYGFRLARGQTARPGEPEARAVREISPPAPETSETRGTGQTTRSGVGQVLRDLWNRIKPK